MRPGRTLLAVAFVALGAAVVGFKGWLAMSGPYLEAMPPFPFCESAAEALEAGDVAEARELAEAGACPAERDAAEAEWNRLYARVGRCAGGVWSGRGDGAAGVGCAVASDLVVFGDVRDLVRQGWRWRAGESTDPVLVALSAAGLALTAAPHVGAGNALLKVARRAGSLSDGLARSVVALARRRAWRPLASVLGDAGRIQRKLGPEGARALAYADTPEDLGRLAGFVEDAPGPLLALRWGGKTVTRVPDPDVQRMALSRGPSGVALVAERGGRALLSRQPLVIFAAKSLYRHGDAAAALAQRVLRIASWPIVLLVGGGSLLAGWWLRPAGRGSAARAPGRVRPPP